MPDKDKTAPTTNVAPANEDAQETAKAAPKSDGKGYATEQRLGGDYFVAPDGYASFNESYVQEHVAAQRSIQAAQEQAAPK